MFKLNSFPSLKNWLPKAGERLLQRGFSGSGGGLRGLKPMWQTPQAIPMSQGGSTDFGWARYFSGDHSALSNLGFLNFRSPIIPDGRPGMSGTRGSLHSSSHIPYSSGLAALRQSGSLITPRVR